MPDTITKGAFDTDEQLYDWVMARFFDEWDRDERWRRDGKESFRFYLGGERQWNDTDLENARKDERPALTINRIKKQIKSAVGFFSQNKLDIRPFPVDSSMHDAATATLMYMLIKHEMSPQRTNFHWQALQVAKEGLICGRGFFVPFIDFTNDPNNGEPGMEWVPWNKILKDSAARFYDMRDATFFIRMEMMPAWKAKQLWPDFSDEIEQALSTDQLSDLVAPTLLREGNVSDGYLTPDREKLLRNRSRNEVMILDCWYRVPKMVNFAIMESTGEVMDWEGSEEEFMAFFGDTPDMRLEKRQSVEVREAVICPAARILNAKSAVFVDQETYFRGFRTKRMLPCIPFFPDPVDDGEGNRMEYGLIEDLKDPQRETNKRRSQFTEAVGSQIYGTYVVDENFSDEEPGTLINKLRRSLAVLWRRQGKNIEKLQTHEISPAFVQLDAMSRQDFFDVGLNPDLMGMPSGSESGRAIMLRTTTSQLQIQEAFENYAQSMTLAGIWFVEMIQQTYHEKRVIAVTGEDGTRLLLQLGGLGEPSMIQGVNGQPPVNDAGETLAGPISDFRTQRFDIAVGTSPYAPTVQIATMSELSDLGKAGYPIDASLIFKFAPIPNKDVIVKMLQGVVPSKPVDQQMNAEIGRSQPQTGAGGETIVPALRSRGG